MDIVRNVLSAHLGAERGIAKDEIVRHHAGTQNLARAVNIPDECVERVDALDEALFDEPPLGAGNDPGDDVERDQPFLRVGFAVDREGNSDATENQLGLAAAIVEHVGRDFGEPARQLVVGRPYAAVMALHFIEGSTHTIPPACSR